MILTRYGAADCELDDSTMVDDDVASDERWMLMRASFCKPLRRVSSCDFVQLHEEHVNFQPGVCIFDLIDSDWSGIRLRFANVRFRLLLYLLVTTNRSRLSTPSRAKNRTDQTPTCKCWFPVAFKNSCVTTNRSRTHNVGFVPSSGCARSDTGSLYNVLFSSTRGRSNFESSGYNDVRA